MQNQKDYGEWPLKQLINELKKRKVRTCGKKAQLVQRFVKIKNALLYYTFINFTNPGF